MRSTQQGVRSDPLSWRQRELAAVEKKVAQVRSEAYRLDLLQPAAQDSLAQQLAKVQEAWLHWMRRSRSGAGSWSRLPGATP